MINISFRQPDSYTDIRRLRDFLSAQNLGYPVYDDWVYRATEEIDQGYKQAVLAIDDGKLVGDVIFQPHKEIRGIREIKNLRVDTGSRFRKFGSFLLRQAEFFRHEEYDWLMGDFRQDQKDMARLMTDEGYSACQVRCLYDDQMDVVAIKQNQFKKKEAR